MRNLKRVLSLALALVMVLGMMVITTSAADFTDAEEITYTEAVEVMSALGILKGYPDGSFKPEGTLTRAEAAKIIAFVCLGADADEYLTGSAAAFEDVAVDNWAAKYVAFCKNAEIINGVNAEQTLFNPKGTLTNVQFAKMLLCALGIEGQFTGEGWENNVKAAAKKAGLNVVAINAANISREEACEMALAAMKYSPSGSGWVLLYKGEPLKYYADPVEAAIAAKTLGADYTVEPAAGDDSLLETVYGVKFGVGADAFGRDTLVYTNVKTGKAAITLYAAEAAYTYTKAVKADDLAVDLKGLKAGAYEIGKDVEADATIAKMVQTNGVEGDLTIAAKKGLEDAIAALTGDHKTVEIYVANGKVSNIVVVDTFYGKVTDVTKADAAKKVKASIEIAGEFTFETTGYEKGDYVAYTKVGTKVQAVEKLDSFTAQLTKYTAKGEYTIGGETYEVAAGIAETVKKSIGKDMIYFTGNNGIIVAVEAPKQAEEAKVTDYVKVLAAAAKSTTTGLLQQVTTWETAVVVLLPDGTTATYELALTTKDGSTTIGKLGTALSVANVEALAGGFYTYTVVDGKLNLVAPQATVAVNSTPTQPVVGEYIINSDTSIILRVTDKKDNTKWTYKVVKGLAAAEKSTVTGEAIVSVIKDAKGNVTAKVVDVIFADTCEFVPAQAQVEGTKTYVYYDGTYEVAYDAVKKVEVYTGTVTKIDGTTVELIVKGNEGAGVFELQSDNTLKAAGTKATVNVIAGDMYNLSGNYVTVNASTKVQVVVKDGALEKGAEVVYFAKDGVATQIFVVKAAPKA